MTTLTAVECPPRWATPRSDRPTYGDEAAEVAAELGFQLMPWQRQVLDVGLEYEPDGPNAGRLHYQEVIHSEPRHSGKTVTTLTRKVWRATRYADRFGEPQFGAYSAQSGTGARRKMFGPGGWVATLQRSATLWPRVIQVRQGMAEPVVRFDNDSALYPLAGNETAGHGDDIHDGDVDEAWKDVDDRREQGILPGQSTIGDSQLWVYSTKGDADAYYLIRKIEMGRALVESGEDADVAFFEWSAPEDCDADDEDVWAATMPALGYTQTLAKVRHARRTMRDGEFRRAYLNQQTAANEAAIPWALYVSRCGPDVKPTGERVHVALDCTPDREWGCITIATRVAGGVAVELVENREGLGWMLGEVRRRAEQRHPARLALQAAGPLANLIPELVADGLNVSAFTQTEMAAAAAWFHDAVVDGTIGIRTHADMDRAVQGARKVKMGDAFRWARTAANVNLAPLVAASAAGWSAHIDSGGALWIHT